MQQTGRAPGRPARHLRLRVLAIADADDACPARQSSLTAYAWTKAIQGRIVVTYNATKGDGSFAATGAIEDAGALVVTANGVGKLKGAHGTISFREVGKSVTIRAGTRDYVGLAGKGTERKMVSGARVHAVISATVAS